VRRTTVGAGHAAADNRAMPGLRDAAEEFLAQKRIAVAGVSRDAEQPANLIYRRLRGSGHSVFAVNPSTEVAEGDPCYPSVRDLPELVDGVVVVTPPDAAEGVVADCAAAGIRRVWLHRGLGPGSSSDAAAAVGAEHGIQREAAADDRRAAAAVRMTGPACGLPRRHAPPAHRMRGVRRTRRPLIDALARGLVRAGPMQQSTALLETVGRRSGRTVGSALVRSAPVPVMVVPART
jgi:uncharacterized protein